MQNTSSQRPTATSTFRGSAKLPSKNTTKVLLLSLCLCLYLLGSWALSNSVIHDNSGKDMEIECNLPRRQELQSTRTDFYDFSFLCQDPAVSYLQVVGESQEQLQQNHGLKTSPKILCVVLTQTKNHDTRLQALIDTWGRKCDKLIAASDSTDPKLSAVKIESMEGFWGIWDKLLQTLKMVLQNEEIRKEDYDWILKADDDTYVIMENLKSFAANISKDVDMDEPLIYGRTIPWPLTLFKEMKNWFSADLNKEFGQRFYAKIPEAETLRFSHGGPGYFMNWKYVESLVNAYFHTPDAVHGEVAEDIANAMTMRYHDVRQRGTVDVETGRERMHPESPQTMYTNPLWLGKMHHGIKESLGDGIECCSPTSISFHYVSDVQMRILDYQLYQCPVAVKR